MDQGSHRTFSGAHWFVGSSFAIVFGLAIDSVARAENTDTANAAPTSQSSTNPASAKAPPAESREDGRTARANGKANGKGKAKDQPSQLVALSTALEVEPEVICKNRKVSGSSIKRRVCGTAQQWEDARKRTTTAAQEDMRQMRDKTTVVSRAPEYPQGMAR